MGEMGVDSKRRRSRNHKLIDPAYRCLVAEIYCNWPPRRSTFVLILPTKWSQRHSLPAWLRFLPAEVMWPVLVAHPKFCRPPRRVKRCRRQPASLQPTPVLPTRTQHAAHRTAQTHLPFIPGAPFVVAAFPPRAPHRILACWKRCWAALRHAFSLSSASPTLARLLDLASTLPNRYAVDAAARNFPR